MYKSVLGVHTNYDIMFTSCLKKLCPFFSTTNLYIHVVQSVGMISMQ